VIGERCWHRLTLYEQHQVLADIIEEDCIAACGTEYNAWPLPDLQAYAEHLMLGLEAMTPDEVHRRFRAEPDPRGEHEASRAYWIAIVTGEGSADSVEA
jgi:hypothetical protein